MKLYRRRSEATSQVSPWRGAVRPALGCDFGPEAVRTLTLQYGIGTAVYALAIPVALVSAVATLVIYAGVLLFYVTERIEGAGSPESRSRERERG